MENVSDVARELFKSELKNRKRNKSGMRYSDELKKFALTLHFYSPRAYEYVRSTINLPSSRALSNWTSPVNSEPGFFKDVFKELQHKAKADPFYRDAALMVDGMSIKAATIFNRVRGH